MAAHDQIATRTYAPLLAQRRRLRERALAAFYRRHGDRTTVLMQGAAPLDSTAAAARAPGARRGGLMRLLRHAFVVDGGRTHPPQATGTTRLGSAATEAALAQRITGPGSGPYSGTPFRPVAGAADGAGRTDAAGGAASEAARHDHGIIDHSRHVSSIGRR
jgi:hypothetical protein